MPLPQIKIVSPACAEETIIIKQAKKCHIPIF
jgi:hypothetical protein